MNYFANKNKNIDHAKFMVNYMETNFKDMINQSIDNTKFITLEPKMSAKAFCYTSNNFPFIELNTCDTITTLFNERRCGNDSRIAVLNFASFKNPGGMFLYGSMAQEEFLCHHSNLYNVLVGYEEKNKNYYCVNRKNTNRALYYNRMLYSPDILFTDKMLNKYNESEDNGFVKADVITCAAPNTSAYLRYYDPEMKDFQKIYEVIKSRIEFIISTVSCFDIDTLILGAYGCGVFGNDPSLIASLFIDSLIQHNAYFRKIIFAIPTSEASAIYNYNYKAFSEVLFEKEKEMKK